MSFRRSCLVTFIIMVIIPISFFCYSKYKSSENYYYRELIKEIKEAFDGNINQIDISQQGRYSIDIFFKLTYLKENDVIDIGNKICKIIDNPRYQYKETDMPYNKHGEVSVYIQPRKDNLKYSFTRTYDEEKGEFVWKSNVSLKQWR